MTDNRHMSGTPYGRPPTPAAGQGSARPTPPPYPYARIYPATTQTPPDPRLAYTVQGQRAQHQPKRASPARMPKAQAQAIVRTLKRWTLVTSIGSFLVLGGVAANNAAHSSNAQATDSGTSTSSSSSDQSGSSSYFNSSGGYSFSSSSSSSQPAVSGSSSS